MKQVFKASVLAATAVALLLLQACVTQSKYNAEQGQYNALQQKYDQLNASFTADQAQVTLLEDQLKVTM